MSDDGKPLSLNSSRLRKSLQLLVGADEALTLSGVVKKDGRFTKEEDLGVIKKPVLLRNNKTILFVGTSKEFNAFYSKNKTKLGPISEMKILGTLMPGYVESHTH